MNQIRIGSYVVGCDAPCFVIAEIGINHNGSVAIAKELIAVAAKAGAQAVKFQKRTVSVVYTQAELAKARLIPAENGILKHAAERGVLSPEAVARLKRSAYEETTNGDLKYALEFTLAEYQEIASFAGERSLVFFASPWDEESVSFLEKLDTPCYKVASACLTDEGLLLRIRETGKPVMLATGGSTPHEIHKAVQLLGEKNLMLMHAVSTYPSQDADLNLNMIRTLQSAYPDVPVGYSGHEKETLPSVVAVALGAKMVERHLTLDRRMWGSDHPASLEPDEFQELIKNIRVVETVLGDGVKRVLPGELEVMKKLRRKNFSDL